MNIDATIYLHYLLPVVNRSANLKYRNALADVFMGLAEPSSCWTKRLDVPNYSIGDAARYAGISPQTVSRWHRQDDQIFSPRRQRTDLSYLQLIEMAVVAQMRDAGFSLRKIREIRVYLKQKMGSSHPFAQNQFLSDGKVLLAVDSTQNVENGRSDLLDVSHEKGQRVWRQIFNKLKEFKYHTDVGVVRSWHLYNRNKKLVIDPSISFGKPSIGGISTRIIFQHYEAGEPISYIAEDFDLNEGHVKAAIDFEKEIQSR